MAPSNEPILALFLDPAAMLYGRCGTPPYPRTGKDVTMNHGKGKALGCLVLVVAVFVCSTRAQHSTGDSPSDSEILPTKFGQAVDRDVTAVRAATESFKVLANAVAAGYDAHVMQCVQNPPDGGMGFHHAKAALRDSNLEVEKPEILTYARTPDGQYKLTGVEYVIPITAWSRNEPPSIMGQNLKRAESLGIWYLHVWIWEPNPSGLFADWNPRVKC
jgi:hypothetical protein